MNALNATCPWPGIKLNTRAAKARCFRILVWAPTTVWINWRAMACHAEYVIRLRRTSWEGERAWLADLSSTRGGREAIARNMVHSRLMMVRTASCERHPADIVQLRASTFVSRSCAQHATL